MAPPSGAQLTEDLSSRAPQRVAAALDVLDRAWRLGQLILIPLPEPDCLEAFGESVPDKVLEQYLRVIENHPGFVPLATTKAIFGALVEAVIRWGRAEHVFDVALILRIDDCPMLAVPEALGHLRTLDLHTPGERQRARWLVEYLLDSGKTRSATVEELRLWALLDFCPEIIHAVRPRLNPDELAQLDLGDDDGGES